MDWVATYKMVLLLNIGNLKWGGSKNVAGFGHVKFEVPLQWPRGKVLAPFLLSRIAVLVQVGHPWTSLAGISQVFHSLGLH